MAMVTCFLVRYGAPVPRVVHVGQNALQNDVGHRHDAAAVVIHSALVVIVLRHRHDVGHRRQGEAMKPEQRIEDGSVRSGSDLWIWLVIDGELTGFQLLLALSSILAL
ncbi:hypothetical protein Tsubulata_006463 [Turnera subulata]|uniref:Uncharacterized protein n=1 Tax=Turnera subulata TaxID=218843 RepID=A0A9Q0F8X1_9ROSI|nr:hypothetical protein Tsubulata_006463 [Turnera subulata]